MADFWLSAPMASADRKLARTSAGFFEVDAEHVTIAALYALADNGELNRSVVTKAVKDLGIDAERPAPWTV